MAFRQIIPRARSTNSEVKVSFTGSKTQYANVYIASELLKRISWDKECRVRVYFDDETPKKWMIEKASDDDRTSFRMVSTKNGSSNMSKLQFKFNECELQKEEKKLKAVSFEIVEGNIIMTV